MLKKIGLFAAAAVAAVALSMSGPGRALARALGQWEYPTLILTSSVNPGGFLGLTTATQVIGAGGTIAADACGGIKRISAATDVTTDTTNTIAAPSASNTGCEMLIVNVSATQTIYLDSNTIFPVTSAASLAIGPKGSIKVFSDGTNWWHGAWTEY